MLCCKRRCDSTLSRQLRNTPHEATAQPLATLFRTCALALHSDMAACHQPAMLILFQRLPRPLVKVPPIKSIVPMHINLVVLIKVVFEQCSGSGSHAVAGKCPAQGRAGLPARLGKQRPPRTQQNAKQYSVTTVSRLTSDDWCTSSTAGRAFKFFAKLAKGSSSLCLVAFINRHRCSAPRQPELCAFAITFLLRVWTAFVCMPLSATGRLSTAGPGSGILNCKPHCNALFSGLALDARTRLSAQNFQH